MRCGWERVALVSALFDVERRHEVTSRCAQEVPTRLDTTYIAKCLEGMIQTDAKHKATSTFVCMYAQNECSIR